MAEIIPYWREETFNVDTEEEYTTYTPSTNFPSIDTVRNRWCYGLPLSKEDGSQMTDEQIKDFIDEAIAEVEHRLGVYIKPTLVVCNPWERGYTEEQYEVEEHPYDYDAGSYQNYGFLQLREKPVLSVEKFKLVLPNGQVIMDFYRDENTRKWVKLDKVGGQINIVPYAGDPTLFAMMGGSASGFPFVTGKLNRNLPHMFYVDYVTGYAVGKLPKDIAQIIGKIAALNILGIAGDAVLVGVASMSTSIDGLSESLSTTASATSATYGAHQKQYETEIKEFFAKGSARSHYRGMTMVGL